MTIDELAQRAGITTRNVRAYQTAGLLPPPRLVGRVGDYDDGHLARLRLIAQLQEQGFSLAGISQLLRAWEEGRSLGDVLGFEQALTAPWSDEVPEEVPAEQMLEWFPEVAHQPELATRSAELGLVELQGDMVRVLSPRLNRVGAELVAAGVPLAAVLDEVAALRADMDRVAERFVALFDRHVWGPFVDAGMPAERLPDVTNALRRSRPLAWVAVEVLLARAMEQRSAANTAARAAAGARDATRPEAS